MSFALALKEPLDAGAAAAVPAGAAAPDPTACVLDPAAEGEGAIDGATDGATDGAEALEGDDNGAETGDDAGESVDTAELGDPGALAGVTAGAGEAGLAGAPEVEALFDVAVANQAVTHPW